ncbi:MAG: hypothetical protein IPO92_08835 [Saprospiraceae bacterium]|nr:hypothetical protein [Saprospiraceae bacterium]
MISKYYLICLSMTLSLCYSCKEKKSIAIGVPGTRIEVYDKEMLNIIDSNAVF